MLVALKDGSCRECKGQLNITGADDVSMSVECLNPNCGEAYEVETDAFKDGGAEYWPKMMAGEEDENFDEADLETSDEDENDFDDDGFDDEFDDDDDDDFDDDDFDDFDDDDEFDE